MIWRRETGAGGRAGVFGCFPGPSHGHPVRAVPLAAFIPSRVPGRGPGGMGRVRVRGAVRRGQSRLAPAPPGDCGGAEDLATSRLAAGQEELFMPPALAWSRAVLGWARAG